VIVTADAINRNADAVVLAALTSRGTDKIYPHEFLVPAGLLPSPSKVKCHSLITWPKEELNQDNYIATISRRDMQGLDMALLMALDLWK
jgi:mRNA-degrading endonuclease toxin of MazEF toxin-antitoxin module